MKMLKEVSYARVPLTSCSAAAAFDDIAGFDGDLQVPSEQKQNYEDNQNYLVLVHAALARVPEHKTGLLGDLHVKCKCVTH